MAAPEPQAAPPWLAKRLQQAGGAVPFATYMAWVLHDPDHGAYGAGRLRIGPAGDFATSPSLGPDFAALLAPQVAAWLEALGEGPLALLEAGPGEGSLAADLAAALANGWPQLAQRTTLVLLEPNPGMEARQRQRLAGCPLPRRWSSFAALAQDPPQGVLLAHEVLDALAVERIVSTGDGWCRQEVALSPAGALELRAGERLAAAERPELERLGLWPPGPGRPAGWSSERHPGLGPWLRQAAAALRRGHLLVIDYALEARRFYHPARSSGTLMAYRQQVASGDPLQQPGQWDLTAHLCLESLEAAALAAGWREVGGCRQGQALLALGLAQRLHGLQAGSPANLPDLLRRREALLRLVDPHALGEFRWQAFHRGCDLPTPAFLREPPASPSSPMV
ncbi:MAG: SAM-dependent methyltransferase [Synechococcaceae cyanobacterium]|nr:SAM-dependent methyltransferase [Synechococcaceae cyanobacterium]